MKAPYILPLLCVICLLSSCRSYFGQKVLDCAEYQAFSNTAYITTDSQRKVLSDGQNYYIELPRQRYYTPSVNFLKCVGSKFHENKYTAPVSGVSDFYKIPQDYARYLTGQSSKKLGKYQPLTPVPDATAIPENCRQLPIVRNIPDWDRSTRCFTYTSPNAGLYNTLGYSTIVLVDAPVTIAQNTALAGAIVLSLPLHIVALPFYLYKGVRIF